MLCSPSERSPTCPCRRGARSRRRAPFAICLIESARRGLVNAAERVWGAKPVARARLNVRHHATRVLANAAVNVAWRCGPVEDIHAGRARHYPLDKRRVTPDEERALICFASDGMAEVMAVCELLASERRSDHPPETSQHARRDSNPRPVD